LPDQPDHLDEVSVDLIIAKQRNGALGRVPLTFRRRFTKFMERL
jgi:replicative DNA helicase